MRYNIEYIKDVIGNNYLGVNIYPYLVNTYLQKMESVLGDEYDDYVNNQKNRDNNKYHITLFSVMECNMLIERLGIVEYTQSVERILDYPIDDLKFLGLGNASRNENTAYFVVLKSEKLNNIREAYGLPNKDLHITLGFKWKDVFGVRKNIVMIENSSFLKLLSDLFYKSGETFNFIKELRGWDYGNDIDDIPVVYIGDSYATFRIGEHQYFSVSELDGELWISNAWEDNKNSPRLSNTIIYRKLKNK